VERRAMALGVGKLACGPDEAAGEDVG